MENATKALLIAAAVLIAILIISLTLVIYRQGANAVSSADLSEAEAAEFNGKFTVFQGGNISTAQVNSLLNTVFSHNKQEKASGTGRFVSINVYEATTATGTTKAAIASNGDATSVPSVSGSTYYKVTCKYNGTIINSIEVTKAQ